MNDFLRLHLKSISIGLLALMLITGFSILPKTEVANAAVGDVLRTLNPSPSGNGRALTFDPVSGHLFYTNYGDPHIYVIDTAGSPIKTLSPSVGGSPINYGALTWQSTPSGGVLWGGRYDGSGGVDKIDPNSGSVIPAFNFSLPAGGSCYSQPPGYIDGLAFDSSDNTLWLGDDAARTVYHVNLNGNPIGGSLAIPSGLCRSGIAVAGNFLWFGLLSGPDQAPYEIGRVSKTDTSTLLQTISINNGGGPEGVALDHSSFPGKCAIWTSQFGFSTTLQAREIPAGLCNGLPTSTTPTPTLISVGLLTFHTFYKDQPVVRGCVATVVNSQNLSTVITAAHCVVGSSAFGGNSTSLVTNLQFAPAHTGGCWAGTPQSTPQIDVDQCGGNRYGVWYASPSDIYISPTYSSTNQADDFAFIVFRNRNGQNALQTEVGGFPITWDTSTDPSTDPLQQQTWRISSYASDDPNFTTNYGFGPFQCDWLGTTNGTSASASRLGVQIGNACSFVNPVTGAENAFNFPTVPPCPSGAKPNDPCHTVPPFGASGSPWTNGQNTGNGTISIGAILSSSLNNCNAAGACLETYQGAKLGSDAQAVFSKAQEAH
jgi:hypothetical protein